MIVYLDTSVVLRVLFREPDPLPVWGRWKFAYSSSLLRAEALRTVDRLRLTGHLTDEEVADLNAEISVVCESLLTVPLTESIMRRAGESFPTVLGTLDAIHLSTALAIHEYKQVDSLLTHDTQLATAARSVGFRIQGA